MFTVTDWVDTKYNQAVSCTVCLGSRNKSIPDNFSLLKDSLDKKKATRVMQKGYNYLSTHIVEKMAIFGSQTCSGLLGKYQSSKQKQLLVLLQSQLSK